MKKWCVVVVCIMIMGVGLFLVSCDGDDSPSTPSSTASFTGVFAFQEPGADNCNNTYNLTLTENEKALSGMSNFVITCTECTATFNLPVNGTVLSAKTGNITISPGSAECVGGTSDYTYDETTLNLVLSDDGNTLNVGDDPFTRQ